MHTIENLGTLFILLKLVLSETQTHDIIVTYMGLPCSKKVLSFPPAQSFALLLLLIIEAVKYESTW